MIRPTVLLSLSSVLLATGCASDPPPREQLRLSEQVIAQARQLEGEASLLDEAEARLLAARSAFAKQAYHRARLLAEQAELDARLAEARALTQRGRQQLDELRIQIEHLRQQLKEQP